LILKKVSVTLFWVVIAFCAAMAWRGIPYLKRR
jgi:hypothetical protein